MAKVKTQFTADDVYAYIDDLDNDQKKKDSLALIELMEEATGEPAKMFGPSIIGFGQYHYKYATGHQGDAPLLGFSPRKAAISLYVFTGCEEHKHLLEGFGKFKMGKACIYIKKLDDINLDVLKNIMQESIAFISDKYERIIPEK
ncbi:hypothetical protein SMI01S_14050 [Sphingobacterium mizutaii NBRC 14946 = DSM 11724]|uniref:Domain of uncharacterized function (DU1801) n=2 Tax=Sphingobacterium mizutaii TaxID=1010 RepID=A0AAJ4XCX7_9SPHI|nr:DUF1801 domain-containing protein [Sphingobacterium mizutaii]GEM67799.1 hypothetical protein SMI01S_14050 [Sphingobacterium mizutaii NBRC 14946 = DSM 11724]SDL00259.1 protein of unknown function (DU1801) [Sphingobacterium mizutaii]SNV49896.1 Domain of uncharacterised function (DU1801) [Sphingobacterium mizutaii]